METSPRLHSPACTPATALHAKPTCRGASRLLASSCPRGRHRQCRDGRPAAQTEQLCLRGAAAAPHESGWVALRQQNFMDTCIWPFSRGCSLGVTWQHALRALDCCKDCRPGPPSAGTCLCEAAHSRRVCWVAVRHSELKQKRAAGVAALVCAAVGLRGNASYPAIRHA